MNNTSLVLLGVVASIQTLAQGPSFNCAKAQGEVEQLICKDTELAALDQKLTAVYSKAVNGQPGGKAPKWMLAEQRGWIKGRDECWKSSEKRNCVEQEYIRRTAEIEAKFRLVKFNGPIEFRCGTPADVITATFHQTEPATAILERGDKSIIAYQTPAASGTKYEGPNVTFWEKGGQAQVTWFGNELKCVSQQRALTAAFKALPVRKPHSHGGLSILPAVDKKPGLRAPRC